MGKYFKVFLFFLCICSFYFGERDSSLLSMFLMFVFVCSGAALVYFLIKSDHAEAFLAQDTSFKENSLKKRRSEEKAKVLLELEKEDSSEENLKSLLEGALKENKDKGEFIAFLSHEMRTPLNGVLGFSKLLSETKLNYRQKDLLKNLDISPQTLSDILKDIFDLSKIEFGKIKLVEDAFDLKKIMEDVSEMLSLKVEEGLIEFVVSYDTKAPRLFYGDSGRIKQIILNLANNALKFTEKGFVLIEAKCEAQKLNSAQMMISVTDSGMGIPESLQSEVFEKFNRGDQKSKWTPGFGLGLTISRNFVELMGGKIGVESKEQKGSKFWFNLGLKLQGKIRIPLRQYPYRVLILDKNRISRYALLDQLTEWGIRGQSFGSFDLGLNSLKIEESANDPFQVVFLNSELESLELVEFIESLNHRSLETKPVLVLLSQFQEAEKINFGEFNLWVLVLKKPFREIKLKEILDKIENRLPSEKVKESEFIALNKQENRPFNELKVLVVEDNFVNQKVAKGFLESLGCNVDLANHGLDAVNKSQSGIYDIAFMDCQMPVMSGYEATKKIKEDWPNLPIIAMTAHAMEGDRRKCLENGMNDYISKPISLNVLKDIIQKWVNPSKIHKTSFFEEGSDIENHVLEDLRTYKMEGKPDLATQLIEIYRAETPKAISRIKKSIESKEPEELKSIAHTLRSSSAQLGAMKLSNIFASFEDLVEESKWTDAENLFIELEEEFMLVNKYFDSFLTKESPNSKDLV